MRENRDPWREDASRTDLGAMAHDGTGAARARGTRGLAMGRVEGFEKLSNHVPVAVWSHPGVEKRCQVVRGFDLISASTFRELVHVKVSHARLDVTRFLVDNA